MPRSFPVTRTDSEWRSLLSPEQFHLLREGGAERAGTSALATEKRPGMYACMGCGSALFDGKAKFESGTGWPSFNTPLPGAIETVADDAYPGGYHSGYGAVRTELVCATCGSHVGHVFADGPPPSGLRYCANGAGLTFTPAAAEETAA